MLALNAVWFVTAGAWSADLVRALVVHPWPVDFVRRGLYIYFPEEAREYVYLVSAGRLRLTRLEATGQEKTIAILGPDALFGELPEGPREFVLEALEDLTVKTVERRALDERAASIMRIAVPSEGGEIALTLPPARLLYTAPRPRLARVLLQLAEEYGVPTLDKQLIVPVKLTARALMHLTCLSEEAVREALEMLLAERTIAFEGRRLFIRHRAELERVAESNV
ncbi:CRP-like cAMP-activated global transcriptional regulator [bacterium HR10]|nr:CRP-like cAMP-activated global transcriptional regulator [bacterium HR10]